MNRSLLFVFVCLVFGLIPLSASAQRIDELPAVDSTRVDRIAAVVNENIISTQDISARTKLALLSSGLPDTPEVRQRLLPQILHSLIDEQLEMQEAKRLDVNVTDDEINQALIRIAHDNNIPGDMKSYVALHGGSPDSLVQQVRVSIAWGKVIQRELRPRVDVGDDEVEDYIERIRKNIGKEEYLVSEIFLAVDSPKDEDQVEEFANNLVAQLKNGANFGAIARQFSQSTGAASGGDIGWIQEGQLPAELNNALTHLSAGEISNPIRSASGYHILGVREKRVVSLGDNSSSKNVTLGLQQVFRPYASNISRDDLLRDAASLRASISNCQNLHATIDQKFPAWHWQDYGDVNLDKTPSWLSDKLQGLPVGSSTIPMATDKGAIIFFICNRRGGDDGINREAITNAIGTQKLELQARRLLRDLRRDAYLDIRLESNPS